MITSQFLLPVHLIEEVFRTQEEVINLAALLVPLGGVVDTQLGLLGEKLADVGHRKDYLLHGAIQPYNLDTIRDAAQCNLWPRPLLHPEYALYIIYFNPTQLLSLVPCTQTRRPLLSAL